MTDIDIAAERERALARRAEQDREERFRTMARSILYYAWNSTEPEIRQRIAERYAHLDEAEVERLVHTTQRMQVTERVRVDPARAEARYRPDHAADKVVIHKPKKEKFMGKAQTIDLRTCAKAQKEKVFSVVDELIAGSEEVTAPQVRAVVLEQLNIDLAPPQASYLVSARRAKRKKAVGKPEVAPEPEDLPTLTAKAVADAATDAEPYSRTMAIRRSPSHPTRARRSSGAEPDIADGGEGVDRAIDALREEIAVLDRRQRRLRMAIEILESA